MLGTVLKGRYSPRWASHVIVAAFHRFGLVRDSRRCACLYASGNPGSLQRSEGHGGKAATWENGPTKRRTQ